MQFLDFSIDSAMLAIPVVKLFHFQPTLTKLPRTALVFTESRLVLFRMPPVINYRFQLLLCTKPSVVEHPGQKLLPQGPSTHVFDTQAPKYLYRKHFKAKVCHISVQAPSGCDATIGNFHYPRALHPVLGSNSGPYLHVKIETDIFMYIDRY